MKKSLIPLDSDLEESVEILSDDDEDENVQKQVYF